MKKTILSVILTFSFTLASYATPLDEARELFKINEYDKVIVVLEKFVKTNPESADAYFILSKCYEAKGDYSKSFEASGIYEKLKYSNLKKEKVEIKPSAEPKTEEIEPKTEEKNSSEIISIDTEYLTQIIAKRDMAKEDSNRKYYDIKKITSLIENIPLSTEELTDFKKKLDFKAKHLIITNEELISNLRADLSMLQINIDLAKYELSQLTEDSKIKEKTESIKALTEKYSNTLNEFEKIINTPVYPNTDQTSFEYYKYANTSQETHIKALEELKKTIYIGIISENKELEDLKLAIIKDQETIASMKTSVTPEMLSAKLETLPEVDKKNVETYNQFLTKIKENKDRIWEIVAEQEVLYSAFNNINATILQINPTYKSTDKPLPIQPKLLEVKEKEDSNKNKEVK